MHAPMHVVLSRTAFLLACLVSIPAFADGNEAARQRAVEASLRPSVAEAGIAEVKWTLSERMAHWKVPGVSIAVIRNGKLAWARGYGVLQVGGKQAIDPQTVFSVGSVSKVGTAATTLRMVDAGALDLDRDVNTYLKRWQVPGNLYTAASPVTLRGILSHSAGLSVHGFADYAPGVPLPDVLDTLEGRAPAKNEPVRVVFEPGERMQYSGGGTTVEQLLLEDVGGQDFASTARRYVLEPLHMTRSTYVSPLPETHGNIAKAHDSKGQPTALPRGYETMPETAASGLWTTPTDYAQLVIALIESYQGQAHDKGGSFLKTATARQMMTEVGRSTFGLGPFLDGQGMSRRFYHSGSNDSYKAWMEGHLATGDGVVIFTNGSNGNSLYPEIRRAVAAVEGWSPALSDYTRVPAIALSEGELQEKAGVYVVEQQAPSRYLVPDSHYRVTLARGSLQLDEGDIARGRRLVPVDVSHFVFAGDGNSNLAGNGNVSVEFVRDYRGVVSSIIYRDGLIVAQARRAR